MKFSLYFLGYENAEDIPKDETEQTRWMFSRKATIELTQFVKTCTQLQIHNHNVINRVIPIITQYIDTGAAPAAQ